MFFLHSLTNFVSFQVAQESLPSNYSQTIHAFSTTTLSDMMKSFSDVSAIRVAGGYLLMVRSSFFPSFPPYLFHYNYGQ